MSYAIRYFCWSHPGRVRPYNQDNYICQNVFLADSGQPPAYPLSGFLSSKEGRALGVFDGLGGEEHGEIASRFAAICAEEIKPGRDPAAALRQYCSEANSRICDFASEYGISSMGTTAALLLFLPKEIFLFNIGDSKIFRFGDNRLEQISVDHYSVPMPGAAKPPLLQCLGIPESRMRLKPHLGKGRYRAGDLYLLCTDGLTDMVPTGEIRKILTAVPFPEAGDRLLSEALARGGKDNITLILCRIERTGLFGRSPRL